MRAYQAVCEECSEDLGPRRATKGEADQDLRGHFCPAAEVPAEIGTGMTVEDLTPEALLQLARKVAGTYVRRHKRGTQEFDDYVQDAAAGGVRALETFDPSRGTYLSTYLWTRMTGAIIDGLRARGHVTRRDLSRAREAQGAAGDDGVGVVAFLPAAALNPTSLDSLLAGLNDDGRGQDRWDAPDLAAGRDFEHVENVELVAWLIEQVHGREREVLERTLLGEETLKAVGASWGVTEGRVCQIRTKALTRLYYRLTKEPEGLSLSA
jgi:RNA polymerase sigma factor for flagellar operon FliA